MFPWAPVQGRLVCALGLAALYLRISSKDSRLRRTDVLYKSSCAHNFCWNPTQNTLRTSVKLQPHFKENMAAVKVAALITPAPVLVQVGKRAGGGNCGYFNGDYSEHVPAGYYARADRNYRPTLQLSGLPFLHVIPIWSVVRLRE